MLEIRTLTVGDALPVGRMREQVLGWEQRTDYVRRAIDDGYGVGTFDDYGRVGFRYQHALTPDTLGDGLLLVAPVWRGRGLGREIVEAFESTAPEQFRLSVVLNTDLIPCATAKPAATGFWQSCGYELVATTGATRVLVRHLEQP